MKVLSLLLFRHKSCNYDGFDDDDDDSLEMWLRSGWSEKQRRRDAVLFKKGLSSWSPILMHGVCLT